MSLGPIMLDLIGTELSQEEKEILQHPAVGGVIYFARNFESRKQITELSKQIHALRDPRLIIAVDHEGGRVQRFRHDFTCLPPANVTGELFDQDRKRGLAAAETIAWLMAAELRAADIDISFAPVLDIDKGISGVIGDRALHQSPERCADLAHAWMKGMQAAGMAATGKHFPGHGHVAPDSHAELPVDERDYVDIADNDLVPFERMIHYGMPAIMVAHIAYPNVDPEFPAGFSPFWLTEVLRNRLGFQGVIFSDDLDMGGAVCMGSYGDRTRAALEAGCDMALVCNNRDGAIEAIDAVGGYNNTVSHLRLIRMHGRGNVSWEELIATYQYRDAVKQVENLNEAPELDLDL